MKKLFLFFLFPLSTLFLLPSAAQGKDKSLQSLFILGGELSNSAATSLSDIDEVMPRMAALGLNTVLVPAYWDLIEPTEGQFDFSLVDRVILRAREHQLKVIFLWFGVWKNSMSCYAPLWFKQDTKRFPRAMTHIGKPLEIASAFSEDVFQADCRAFTRFMRHLAEADPAQATVIMIQIENEIGMLEDARDHSPLAERAFRQPIPERLIPVLRKSGKGPLANGKSLNSRSTWQSVATADPYWDEQFMAWHYASYVERLAQVARSIMPHMPLYVNAAMNSRGRKPGEYPSAGPLAHLAPIWRCAAPSVDILAPDIYDTGFKAWAAQYALPDNPLFIPESRCCINSGVRAIYAFGEHHALGFSPFAIDQAPASETQHVSKAYALLSQLQPYLKASHPSWGLLFDQQDRERIITDGNTVLTCRHFFTLPWDPRATDGSTWPEGGATIIRLAPGEYLLAGSGEVVDFKTKSEKAQEQQSKLGEDGFAEAGNDSPSGSPATTFSGRRLGIGFVDEVKIAPDGTMTTLRRDGGDQSHQGRHARISVGDYRILHIKLYEY